MTKNFFLILSILLINSLYLLPTASLFVPGKVQHPPQNPLPPNTFILATNSLSHTYKALLTRHGDFYLQLPPNHEYTLQLATHYPTSLFYSPLRIILNSTSLVGVEQRPNVLIPKKKNLRNDNKLEFVRNVQVEKMMEERERGWWNGRLLVKWALYIGLGLGFAGFVMWFPKVIQGLSDEGFEALTGEKRVRIRDPNAVGRELWGQAERRENGLRKK